MRRFMVLGISGGLFVAAMAGMTAAHANSACSNADGTPTVAPSGTGGTAQVCVTQGPVTGTVTASGDAATMQGYVVADGSPSNPGALAGYLGVDGANGTEVVGCASGDYSYGGGNQVIAVPPAGAPDPTGPCAPTVP